jgi:hypothetical protein
MSLELRRAPLLSRRSTFGAIGAAIGSARFGYAQQKSGPTERFAGYTWDVKTSRRTGPGPNRFAASNVSVEVKGLHLRITKGDFQWTCAEVILRQPLGYGRYGFVVEDVGHLDPNMVLGLFTWDPSGRNESYREIDIELGRWGNENNKNGQFVLQPWQRDGNRIRFEVSPGPAEYSFDWTPGRVACRTVQRSWTIHSHEFTSGVPSPGDAQTRINFWLVQSKPPKYEAEVIVSDFSFRPSEMR